MKNKRRAGASGSKKEGAEKSNADPLSLIQMPYEILIMILSLLPVNDVVVVCSLRKEWKFLWCDITQLDFDAMKNFYKVANNRLLYSSERSKYIEQVNSVIRSYNRPVVHRFRITFDLDDLNQRVVDEWLQFAVNKNVEILELDMRKIDVNADDDLNYDFPLTLPNSRVVELVSLKKLFLNNVKLRDGVLEVLLTRSPHLESISIHNSSDLTRIRVVGRHLNLKHFQIGQCFELESLLLSDFDLVSFTYMGLQIDLCLTNLPKLEEVSIFQGLLGLENVVLNQLSSFASSLHTLSLTFHRPEKNAKFGSIPQLPNLKKLKLKIGAYEDESLLEFASIAKACPMLETFIIELLWFSPIRTRRKARRVANDHRLENLKIFEFLGYYGRTSDFELVLYVIEHAVALQEIVIDPNSQNGNVFITLEDLDEMDAARSSAKRHMKRIMPMKPPGVELIIL